jgi:hypothetical protein
MQGPNPRLRSGKPNGTHTRPRSDRVEKTRPTLSGRHGHISIY